MTVASLFAFCLLITVAEVLASLLIWTGSPADWVGEPLRFWTYELWRLQYWATFLAASAFLWVIAWVGLRRRVPKTVFGLLAMTLATTTEVLTSNLFWHRLNWRHASAVGWSYFPWYFRGHLICWTALVALGLWYFYKRRREPQVEKGDRLMP